MSSAIDRTLRGAIEVILLGMVCASPWVYGAVHPGFEFFLHAGVGLLLALWAARMLCAGCLTWKRCPVALCLAGLFLIGVWQVTPLSRSLLQRLSPATARLYDQLLPVQPEILPDSGDANAASPPAGSTLSLYPGATQKQLGRLLAVFLVFVIVRNNLAPTAGLRRLSAVVLVNGAALALFALFQFFTSPPNRLYWSFATLGQPFGPFICRNHYPFYINLCIGLGTGLLLSRRTGASHRYAHGWRGRLASLLHDAGALWICTALALMTGSVAVCLSRGGILALVGGFLVCLLVKLSGSPRWQRFGIVLVAVGMAGALAAWFGLGPVGARLATLWDARAVQESRLDLWARVWPAVLDFPWWGTGYGTFQYLEPLHRTPASATSLLYDHAHNDYLELLIEGGGLGLALGLLAVGLVIRLGRRALRRLGGRSASGLALGALAAFTTLVIHGFGDFGTHIPAITLLAAVLGAYLCGLASARTEGRRGVRTTSEMVDENTYRLRWWGAAPVAGAFVSVALGWMLASTAWTAHRVERLQWAALRAREGNQVGGQERALACLAAAVRLDPLAANLHVELARAHLDRFEAEWQTIERRRMLAAVTAVVLAWPSAAHPAAAALSPGLAAMAHRRLIQAEREQLRGRDLVPGLRHYLQARDACPLLSGPHLALALDRRHFERAETSITYFDRAKLLAPADADVWYLCGLGELREQPERTWASWRHALECSDRYFSTIFDQSVKLLGPTATAQKVLPDQPDLLLAAAKRLHARGGTTADRQPIFAKALTLLEAQPQPRKAGDRHLQAQAYRALGRSAEALAVYDALLSQEPLQMEWRYERAQCLYELRRLAEARRELRTVLAQQPGHRPARELLSLVGQEVAIRRQPGGH